MIWRSFCGLGAFIFLLLTVERMEEGQKIMAIFCGGCFAGFLANALVDSKKDV